MGKIGKIILSNEKKVVNLQPILVWSIMRRLFVLFFIGVLGAGAMHADDVEEGFAIDVEARAGTAGDAAAGTNAVASAAQAQKKPKRPANRKIRFNMATLL